MSQTQYLALALALSLLSLAIVFGIVFYSQRKKRKEPTKEVSKPAEQKLAEKVEPGAPTPPPSPKVSETAKVTDEQRVTRGLSKTKSFFQKAIDQIFTGAQGEKFYEDLEEVLLTADVGISFAEKITQELRSIWGLKLPDRSALKTTLSDLLVSELPKQISPDQAVESPQPHVILIVGVNGAGKTTTIAKLCQRFQRQGKSVLVGAADTFRAAAVDQLKTWIERVGAQGVFQKEGSDPSAVAFDAVQAAVSRKSQICLIDTAGRLHTKANLMEELKKMKRVVGKALPGAPHDVWLVVDGCTGQNALNQAREFHQNLGLTGVIVTKLDGSAKGGAVLAISSELKVPIVFIGVGEAPEDLVVFNGEHYVQEMLEGL